MSPMMRECRLEGRMWERKAYSVQEPQLCRTKRSRTIQWWCRSDWPVRSGESMLAYYYSLGLVVVDVFLIFQTNELEQFRVGRQARSDGDGPWFRIRLRVVNGDLNIHMAEILPMESFDHVQSVGRRLSELIEPDFPVETDGIDDECIAFPFTQRIAKPRLRKIIQGQAFAPVQEHLSPEVERLVDEHDEIR